MNEPQAEDKPKEDTPVPEKTTGAGTPQEEEEEEDLSLFQEFWLFLKEEKVYWITPIVVVLLALGALLVLTEGSAVAPFIYTLF